MTIFTVGQGFDTLFLLVLVTIWENITYSHLGELTEDNVLRTARAAHVHDFVTSLLQATTPLSVRMRCSSRADKPNVSKLPAWPSRILILGECTLVLDGTNQTAVLKTIQSAKVEQMTAM